MQIKKNRKKNGICLHMSFFFRTFAADFVYDVRGYAWMDAIYLPMVLRVLDGMDDAGSGV